MHFIKEVQRCQRHKRGRRFRSPWSHSLGSTKFVSCSTGSMAALSVASSTSMSPSGATARGCSSPQHCPSAERRRSLSCIYVYVFVYICIFVYMSICLYVYISICVYVYMSICLYVYMSICLYVYMSICLYVYMSICLYVHMYVCLYV